ncbi:hypothetical protein KCU77_g21595, partial [Aureobasidium melanogenum]
STRQWKPSTALTSVGSISQTEKESTLSMNPMSTELPELSTTPLRPSRRIPALAPLRQ